MHEMSEDGVKLWQKKSIQQRSTGRPITCHRMLEVSSFNDKFIEDQCITLDVALFYLKFFIRCLQKL